MISSSSACTAKEGHSAGVATAEMGKAYFCKISFNPKFVTLATGKLSRSQSMVSLQVHAFAPTWIKKSQSPNFFFKYFSNLS
jgi:hypothetical protein